MSKTDTFKARSHWSKSWTQTIVNSIPELIKKGELLNPKWWRDADHIRVVVNSNEQAKLTWSGDIHTMPHDLPFYVICDYRRLPKWLKDKVLKLSIMGYPHTPIPKLGRRVGERTYLVLPPPSTTGPKSRSKYGTSSR